MIDLDVILRYLKGRCHDNQFCGKMANFPHLSLWHSETEWDIAASMCINSENDASISHKNFVDLVQ